ncbi:hypothetical protein B0J11DRAFT_157876 [Dendryphion nanum]|uniref:ATP-dependent DNA ligase family profile domain-containing protein n=1 Tax=Dendryphion nanum TaxID=256645 RepID=A0A9P9IVR5_9PLEO|nr:hypothetical protein B0J11DRAFT_157876 [Dendryphion nanum]
MSLTFNHICELLQGVEDIAARKPPFPQTTLKERIEHHISKWFIKYREPVDKSDTHGCAFLSVLFPHRRKDRVYGLQAPSLATKLAKLLNFNHGQKALFDGWPKGSQGDLGVYLERAMRPWNGTLKKKPITTIETVDRLLTQLAARNRFSDPKIQNKRDCHIQTDTELRNIFMRLDAWEAKWLTRLLLRDYCTISMDETFVFKSYHFLLPDLLLFQNDFEGVFDLLRGDLASYPPSPPINQEKQLRVEAAEKLKAVVGIKIGRPTYHKAWSFKHLLQLTEHRVWAAEVKYDGEYCEIHVDMEKELNDLLIFSKNGKDATTDRRALHDPIRTALRIGEPECMFQRNCVVLGELVLYSDREHKILPFSKTRKHISRSGSFLGSLQDSPAHEWEHLMIVYFDVLVIDDTPVLQDHLQERRQILRELVRAVPGRSMRSEWTLLDMKDEDGVIDLKQAFARSLAQRQEGLILKPLRAPYFSLLSELNHQQSGYFVKLKKDYLSDMGGERDLGDFAIVGASFDPQVAAKTTVKPLHWTHFYLGCVVNKTAVHRTNNRPTFKIVGCLSLDKRIPKQELKYLNTRGRLLETELRQNGNTETFTFERSYGYGPRMSIAFKDPFVAEILGGGYEQVQNETFEMLRHPRLKRVHHDRSWRDTVTMEELERMAEEKWENPNPDELDGHAKDVALLVRRYVKEMGISQTTNSEYQTTQETIQCTTPRSTQTTQQESIEIAETQQDDTQNTSTTTTTLSSQYSGSTQGAGIRASKAYHILVREDTSERLESVAQPPSAPSVLPDVLPTPPICSAVSLSTKRRSFEAVTPPPVKRKRLHAPLAVNKSLEAVNSDHEQK